MTKVLPHNRISILIDEEGNFSDRFKKSIDSWSTSILNDDGIFKPIENDGIIVKAQIIAKENGIFVGEKIIEQICNFWGSSLTFNWYFSKSSEVSKDEILAEITGSKSQLLKLERSILNILGRLSGIASTSKKWTNISQIPIAATRKTTWGLLDKWAAHLGGALTHRLDRNDALMLKENDLAANYSKFNLEERIKFALENIPVESLSAFIIIEVENKNQAIIAAETWNNLQLDLPLTIMLDNINIQQCNDIINSIRSREQHRNIFFEASGGITIENLIDWKNSLVDVISSSSIHRGTKPLDISLLILED